MIQLSTDATSGFSYLATPPTHALCTTISVSHLAWQGVSNLQANYFFGTILSGVFTPNLNVPVCVVNMPTGFSNPDDIAHQYTLLHNLLSTGVVPNPENAMETIAVATKGEMDFKIYDVDVIVSYSIPALKGTAIE